MAARPYALIRALAITLALWIIGGVLRDGFARWQVDRTPLVHLLPAGVLRVGLDPTRPPFAFFDDIGNYQGIEPQLAQALGAALEVDVQLVGLGFDGLYDALRSDQVDVILAGLTPESTYGKPVAYTAPYYDAGLVLISADPRVQSMRDLPTLRLAVEFGSPAEAEARRWLQRVAAYAILPYELPSHTLDAVRFGQADAALIEALLADRAWRNPAPPHITHTPYVAVTRSDRVAVRDALNRTLQRLAAAGTLDSILNDGFMP